MRIYTSVTMDWDGNIIESESFDYQGPVSLCGDGSMGLVGGGDGGATLVDDGGVTGDVVESPDTTDTSVGVPESDVGDRISLAEPESYAEPEAPATEEHDKPILPAQLTKALREMREAHPDQAQALKELQRSYFARQEFAKVFTSPEEALDAKATMEMLGGKEGIARLRAYESVIQDIDDRVDRGDRSVVEEMARSSPDGFKQLIPHGLEILQTLDRVAYKETVQPLVLNDLKASGFVDYLTAAATELAAGETERANRYLKGMQQWISDAEASVESRKNRYQDPRLVEIQDREKRVSQQAAKQLHDYVDSDLSSYKRETVSRATAGLARERRLSPDAHRDMIDGVMAEIDKLLGSNNFYEQSMNSLYREANREKITNYGKAQIDQIRQRAINSVWTRRYGSLGAPRRKPAGESQSPQSAQPQQARSIPVAARPSWKDVDMSKTTQDMYLNGKAYLKSGKFVSWKSSLTSKI